MFIFMSAKKKVFSRVEYVKHRSAQEKAHVFDRNEYAEVECSTLLTETFDLLMELDLMNKEVRSCFNSALQIINDEANVP